MSKTDEVLSLIKEGYSLNEIPKLLSLNIREYNDILKQIKNRGYNFNKTITSSGQIILKPNKSLNFDNNSRRLRINVKDRFFRCIFISDLHIGSIYERPKLLPKVFDYAKVHDIHIIINAGDTIDNIYPESNQVLINKTLPSQIKKLIRVYPYAEDIITLNLGGNHEYKSIIEDGYDILRKVESSRYDMVSLGYGMCKILLKDDSIAVIHDLKKSSKLDIPNDVSMIYKGHSHKAKNSYKEQKKTFIPAFSEDGTGAYEYKPLMGFLDVQYIFYDKLIERINTKQLAIVNGQIRQANEESVILRKIPHQRNIDKKE